jgi:hypothetical protein
MALQVAVTVLFPPVINHERLTDFETPTPHSGHHPRAFADKGSLIHTGEIAEFDPDWPVLRMLIRCGQDRIASGTGADVETPGSRVGLAGFERTSAQNDTVDSLKHASSKLKRSRSGYLGQRTNR